jgi:sugar phosphate isomerase/epimerase
MKFAFATPSTPPPAFEALAERALGLGYDGVELSVLPDDLRSLQKAFTSAGIEIACLAAPVSMPHRHRSRMAAAGELRRWLDVACSLACRWVKIPGFLAPAGQSGAAAAVDFARWLTPIADDASQRSVTIVVENAHSFRKAKEVWTLLESINHPSVAACWDLFNATQAGESPYISVPCLNSRIQYARVRHVQSTPAVSKDCKLGEGNVPVENFITRLRGIGFGGYVTVDATDSLLSDAIQKLRAWGKPAAAHAGKKPAAARSSP